MSRKGPVVGRGMLDFIEDIFVGVKSHYYHQPTSSNSTPQLNKFRPPKREVEFSSEILTIFLSQ